MTKTRAPKTPSQTLELLKKCCKALDDKKAENMRVLDVSALSSITNYLVLVTGNSDPHLRALRIEIERVLDEAKAKIVGVDQHQGSGWTVVDAFDLMIHVFTPENREKYRLELLWKDAKTIPLSKILGSEEPEIAAAKKPAPKKVSAKKTAAKKAPAKSPLAAKATAKKKAVKKK